MQNLCTSRNGYRTVPSVHPEGKWVSSEISEKIRNAGKRAPVKKRHRNGSVALFYGFYSFRR